jgi:hypothetical protein
MPAGFELVVSCTCEDCVTTVAKAAKAKSPSATSTLRVRGDEARLSGLLSVLAVISVMNGLPK